MLDEIQFDANSNILRAIIRNATTGARLTGLAHDTAGLIISTIADNEATAVAYTQAAGNIETITTLGTYAAPSASKCRFKEVDPTNHPGMYEFQFADARYAVASARKLYVSASGANAEMDGIVFLNGFDRTAEPPTDQELADLAAASVQTSAALNPLPSNVKQANDVEVVGVGTDGDPWRAAT